MAKARKQTQHHGHDPKKTRIGKGKNTKWGNKGGGPNGSTVSKCYKKKYRGQGK
tara:strand:- start:6718 stop:6879 length:162 start_codon:yes stop_codon:yes gene_type:complete